MRLIYSSSFWAIFFLFLISLFALKDLARPGLYTSHDGETHTARIAQYSQALKDGQIPPRFAGSFYNGFGSPIFVYIYPMPYILGSIAHFIGFSFVSSFKLVMGASFLFSAIFMFLWLKEFFKNKIAALLGALFYVLSPYRLAIIFVRGSISENLAYTFLPLIFYFLTKLSKRQSRVEIVRLSLAISFFLLSQNLVVLISAPILILYTLFLFLENKSKRFIVSVAISSLLAFLLSSFTLLPTFFERDLIKIDEIIKSAFGDHFVTFKQLIYSPWGYGFDLAGTLNDQMSFQLGLAHILSFCLFIAVFAASIIKSFIYKKAQKTDLLAALFLLTLIFSITIQLDYPFIKKIWGEVEAFHIIDIPWRFTGLAILCLTFLTAYTFSRVKLGVLAVLLVIAVIIANRNHLRINKPLYYDDKFFLNYSSNSTQYGEFTPKFRTDVSNPEFSNPTYKIRAASGWASFENIRINSRNINFDANVLSESAVVRVNKFYFPGAQVDVNNQKLKVNKDFSILAPKDIRLDTKRNNTGIFFLNLKKGANSVEITFGETLLRQLANLVSLFTLLLLIYIHSKNVKLFR